MMLYRREYTRGALLDVVLYLFGYNMRSACSSEENCQSRENEGLGCFSSKNFTYGGLFVR